MKKVKLEVEIRPDELAALEAVAKRSDCTVKDTLEGMVNTALDDLNIEERRGDPVSLIFKVG